MKKTKILTVLGVLLAMGITACGGGKGKTSKPAGDSSQQQGGDTSQQGGGSSQQGGGSSQQGGTSSQQTPQKDATGHIWGADSDVAASGEGVAYKKATCTESDNFIRVKVNESAITNADRKSGTPDGYLKLSGDGKECSFKFNYDSYATGKLYFFGVMDGYSSNYTKNAFYVNGTPNLAVKVNGQDLNLSGLSTVKFQDVFGDPVEGQSLSNENYALIADVILEEGMNEIIYKRVQTLNMLIKDFVFVVQNGTKPPHEHAADATWHTDAENHWHECTAGDGYKLDNAAHTFGAETIAKDASCSEEGSKTSTCSVCGYVKTETIAKLAHTFEGENDGWVVKETATCEANGSEERECTVCHQKETRLVKKLDHQFGDMVASEVAGEGYIATASYNCELCHKSALRWNARDFDTALSSTNLDLTHDGDKSVRFASGEVENSGGAESTGSHIVYNVKVGEAVAKAGLSFKIKNTGGSGWTDKVAPVFNKIAGDSANGFSKQGDEFVDTGKRYGLKVNDVEYFLGDDAYGNQSSVTGWFDWPIEFPLQAGVNKIDVFAYAGYRADLYEFQFTGLPEVEVAHVHNNDDVWEKDANNHWHVCTAAGCPLEATGGIYDQAAHDFEAVEADSVAATCEAEGLEVKVCKVCGYRSEEVIEALGHNYVKDEANCVAPTCDAAGVYAEKCSRDGCSATRTQPHYKDMGTYGAEADKTQATEGCATISIFNCQADGHHHSAYQWAATAYDQALTAERSSSGKGPESRQNGAAIRFSSEVNFQDKNEAKKGTHIVYKINAPEAVNGAILSFFTGNRTDIATVFAMNENDTAKGYEKDEAGEFYRPAHRYGLKVNGVNVVLGYDDYTWASGNAWYSFPGTFNLQAGVNEIEVYNLGGYRADMYNFRVSGMPEYVSLHEHQAAADWSSDDNYHWHACVAEGCDNEGIQLDKAEHSWGEPVVVPATQDAEGSETYTCSVCGKVKVVKLDKLPLQQWMGDDIAAGFSDTPAAKNVKTFADGTVGYKTSCITGGKTLTLSYNAAAAETVKLRMYLSIKTSNNNSTGFWKHNGSEKMRITVNGTQLTPPAEDINFKNLGCTVNDTQADDNGKLAVPVWADIANIDLQEGANSIVFTVIDTNYSFFICGVALSR